MVSLPVIDQPELVTLVSRKPMTDDDRDLIDKLKIEVVTADLTRRWDLDRSVTHVIQLAADGSSNAYSQRAADDFVTLSQRLIEWCELLETKPVVFHASSGACYGYFPLSNSHSDTNLWSKAEFVVGRLTAERLLQESDERGILDLRIGRLYSFIGKHLSDKTHYAVPSFVSMAKMNRVIRLNGNPLTTRSYMSTQEMAHWIITAVKLDTAPSMLTIGSSIPVTMIELVEFVAENLSAEVRIENPNSVGDRYVAENSLTKKALGVEETTHWRQSLLEFINLSRLDEAEGKSNE